MQKKQPVEKPQKLVKVGFGNINDPGEKTNLHKLLNVCFIERTKKSMKQKQQTLKCYQSN